MNALLRKGLRKGCDLVLLGFYLTACIVVLTVAFVGTLALLARM